MSTVSCPIESKALGFSFCVARKSISGSALVRFKVVPSKAGKWISDIQCPTNRALKRRSQELNSIHAKVYRICYENSIA